MNTKKRILISGGLAAGGVQTHLSLLCRVLREAGAEVTIAASATNWPKAAIEQLSDMGVRVLVPPYGFGRLAILGKMEAFLTWPFRLRKNYDILYCIGSGRMHLWTQCFVRKGGSKIYHEIVEVPTIGSAAEKVCAKMDALSANSKSVSEAISQLFPSKPTRVLPALLVAAPVPPPAPRPSVGGRELRVAYMGRIVSHKRPDCLIEAWPALAHRVGLMPARLDLYGDDYDGKTIRALQLRVEKLGLTHRIKLHGPYTTSDIPRILEKVDMVVLPSLFEGLPLVLVQTMLYGVPVVATSAGGINELGEENPDVVITPGTDWDFFVEGVEELAGRLRAGTIDSLRLHNWTEARYGYEVVSKMWCEALLNPDDFFRRRN